MTANDDFAVFLFSNGDEIRVLTGSWRAKKQLPTNVMVLVLILQLMTKGLRL